MPMKDINTAPLTSCCTRENTDGKNKDRDDKNIMPMKDINTAPARRRHCCFTVVRFYFLSTERLGEYNKLLYAISPNGPTLYVSNVSIVHGTAVCETARAMLHCCGADVTTNTRTSACTRGAVLASCTVTRAFSTGNAYLPTGGGLGDLRTPATWVGNSKRATTTTGIGTFGTLTVRPECSGQSWCYWCSRRPQ
uniref:Uncharacterized protein n=1 Tax=Schizaphis graminum TaxID=13262 RepID=A0A2S2PR80_SCHGA